MAKLSNGRRWRNTELKGNDVGRFKEFLRYRHINFETSEVAYGYIHFEVLVDEAEEKLANEFLDRLDDEFDDSAAWKDDSDRSCGDCPDDECTGHCMSCYYRTV